MQLELISRRPESDPRPTPLLFVHGAWHAAWCWAEHFLPYFAAHGYVSHALSLRGHGASEGREHVRRSRGADYAADVAQIASQLPQPPVVIGHSLGGYAVQKYLEAHPAPAAVLVASVPHFGALKFFLKQMVRHPLVFLKATVTLNGYPFVGTPQLARESLFSADLPEEQLQRYFAQLQDESYLAGLDASIFNLPNPSKVSAPMLVLGAANDVVFPVGDVESTARAYHTQAVIFPKMAHDMMLEAGWQAVADRILAWLKERNL